MAQNGVPIKIIAQTLEGADLHLGKTNVVDFISDAQLTDSSITIHSSARGVCFSQSRFVRCKITAKRPLFNVQWTDLTFEDCTFYGKYIGAEFGYRPVHPDSPPGAIVRSSFLSATLHQTTFNSCDVTSLSLPSWPHFTMVDPQVTASRLAPSDNTYLRVIRDVLLECPAETVAITLNASHLADKAGLELEDIRRYIRHVEQVIT